MSAYDYRYLQSEYPFNSSMLEKVCRISDTLERITQVPFLRERLSLYGGTALNFIHFKGIQRLSVDIDFNYRHQGEDTDWGEIREEIDEDIKAVLGSQGYGEQDIKIDASYPLGRFTVKYINHLGADDSFKIETGYMNRIPVLAKDAYMGYSHIGTGRSFKVKTPMLEEIYANKLITMLDRATPRDLYDVNAISETSFDNDTLRKCAVVESLMSLKKPITDLNPDDIVKNIPFDSRIRSVARIDQEQDISIIRHKASGFSRKVIDGLTDGEHLCIEKFYDERRFQPELLDFPEMHPAISSHPGILWALR
jgi:predicted nucleotidyltransferase component of viral defense system